MGKKLTFSENNSRSEKYLSISGFAEKYGKSRPTVYKMLEKCILPLKQIGKRLKIDVSNPELVRKALHSLPGVGNWVGRSCNYKPIKRKCSFDTELDLQYEIYEREQAEKRAKRKLARIKKLSKL